MTPITIHVHGIPVVLTLDEAMALRAALDEHLPPPLEWLADTAWQAGATWMRDQTVAYVESEGEKRLYSHPAHDLHARMLDEERSLALFRAADGVRALPLAPTLDEHQPPPQCPKCDDKGGVSSCSACGRVYEMPFPHPAPAERVAPAAEAATIDPAPERRGGQ